MDIDRNKINEMKSECLQMPDYIRDMIEETVEQQLKKKQRYGKKMWRVAAAILAFACVGGGTTLAAAKLYNMHLEQQGKYGSTLIYGEATNTDATDTDAEVDQNALYTLDVSYVPDGMKVDGLDDIYADGNNYVKKVVLFPEDSPFIGGVSFWFLKMPTDQQVSFDETHVISTKELDIDGKQAIVIERQVQESAIREVQYELYVTYENNYLLDMVVFDDTELDTAIDIVKGLKLTATDDPEAKRRIVAEEYSGQMEEAAAPVYEADATAGKENRFTETSKESMEEHMHQVGESFDVPQSSLTAKVSKVELLDSPDAIDAAYALDPVKTDAEGKLVNNVIAYEKRGNGIDQLDEVVETKEVKEKILYIEVAYTNTSDQQTGDTMFQCGLLWAKETGDGYETVDVYAKDDVDYDSYYGQNYRISDVPLYYYNGKSAEEKNHLIRVQPGETRTVTLAFLVTEDELPYLYLDLFSGNDDYTQFRQSALLYGYVDIRQ